MPQNTPPRRTTTIHGVSVTQLSLQGKFYTPVDGRVKIAEQADPALVRREGAGYHVAHVEILTIGDRYAYHCLVEYPAGSGVLTPGTDFIDLRDPAGIAKAETSAIGRALGLHGIAIEESIASAEEASAYAADQQGEAHQQPHQHHGQPQQPTQPPQAPQPQSVKPAAAADGSRYAQGADEWDPSADTDFCRRVRALGITTGGQLKNFLAEADEIHGATRKQRAYALLHEKERLAARAVEHDLRTQGPTVGREGVRA